MDHGIDAINMSLLSPEDCSKSGLPFDSKRYATITDYLKLNDKEAPSFNFSEVRNLKRTRAPGASEEQISRQSENYKVASSDFNSKVVENVEVTKETNAQAASVDNSGPMRTEKNDPDSAFRIRTSFDDGFDHVFEEVDLLSRSWNDLRDQMYLISIKNAIVMDDLASLGLDV